MRNNAMEMQKRIRGDALQIHLHQEVQDHWMISLTPSIRKMRNICDKDAAEDKRISFAKISHQEGQ